MRRWTKSKLMKFNAKMGARKYTVMRVDGTQAVLDVVGLN